LSFIRMDAEGPDYRRHTVLQRSRTSEAVGTSAISDHRSFTSSFIRILHTGVVVKKNFINVGGTWLLACLSANPPVFSE